MTCAIRQRTPGNPARTSGRSSSRRPRISLGGAQAIDDLPAVDPQHPEHPLRQVPVPRIVGPQEANADPPVRDAQAAVQRAQPEGRAQPLFQPGAADAGRLPRGAARRMDEQTLRIQAARHYLPRRRPLEVALGRDRDQGEVGYCANLVRRDTVPVEQRPVIRDAPGGVADEPAQVRALVGDDLLPRGARVTRHAPDGRENIGCPDHQLGAVAGTGSGRKSGSPRRRRTPLHTTEDVAPGT